MITLKQLETLQCVAELGTFERAAAKLNTTQSAISKRIQQLEDSIGLPIFDRSQRGARLTERGEELLALTRDMLSLRGRISDLKLGSVAPARRIRLGVTELTAVTWLPQFVSLLSEKYPTLIIEPEVDMTRNLLEALQEDSIDLIIIPKVHVTPEMTPVDLTEVRFVWMAKPGLVKARRTISLEDIAQYPVIAQARKSGSGMLLGGWFKSNGVNFKKVLFTNNFTAALGMTVAGLGVSYLPEKCLRWLVTDKKLEIVRAKPALPLLPYAAVYRNDRPAAFISSVVELAREACDFSTQILR